MSITDPKLVNIEIVTLAGDDKSGLRLTDRGKVYNLVRVFASHQLDLAQQQLQQLHTTNSDSTCLTSMDKYVLVREANYYSLWELDRLLEQAASSLPPKPATVVDRDRQTRLELQQASIWLFQELWLQWQDLLGDRQLHLFATALLAVTPSLQSQGDLDRLLSLDPLATKRLEAWSNSDWIEFDRQLYHLTQKKVGRQFGTNLTIDITQAMPEALRSTLTSILSI
jgi:hypothetical protein